MVNLLWLAWRLHPFVIIWILMCESTNIVKSITFKVLFYLINVFIDDNPKYVSEVQHVWHDGDVMQVCTVKLCGPLLS